MEIDFWFNKNLKTEKPVKPVKLVKTVKPGNKGPKYKKIGKSTHIFSLNYKKKIIEKCGNPTCQNYGNLEKLMENYQVLKVKLTKKEVRCMV